MSTIDDVLGYTPPRLLERERSWTESLRYCRCGRDSVPGSVYCGTQQCGRCRKLIRGDGR